MLYLRSRGTSTDDNKPVADDTLGIVIGVPLSYTSTVGDVRASVHQQLRFVYIDLLPPDTSWIEITNAVADIFNRRDGREIWDAAASDSIENGPSNDETLFAWFEVAVLGE